MLNANVHESVHNGQHGGTRGRSGDDQLDGTEGPNWMVGGAGNDTFAGGGGNDTFVGGAGNDVFFFNGMSGRTTIKDFHSGDMLHIDGLFADVDEAMAAVTYVRGGAVIDLGDGNTITLQGVKSLSAADFDIVPPVVEEPPADPCETSGDDTTSADQDDVIRGTIGDDTIDGGPGNDAIWGDFGNDSLMGSEGNDFLSGQSNDDTLDGGMGNDSLHGGSGNDVVTGGCGNDQLVGLSGHDMLDGGAGDDTIAGDLGDDTINGGSGDDLVFLGGGDDLLNYEVGGGADRVGGFTAGQGSEDVIDLSSFGLAGLDDLLALSSEVGGNVVVDFGNGDTLTLFGVQTSDLHADDFWF